MTITTLMMFRDFVDDQAKINQSRVINHSSWFTCLFGEFATSEGLNAWKESEALRTDIFNHFNDRRRAYNCYRVIHSGGTDDFPMTTVGEFKDSLDMMLSTQ